MFSVMFVHLPIGVPIRCGRLFRARPSDRTGLTVQSSPDRRYLTVHVPPLWTGKKLLYGAHQTRQNSLYMALPRWTGQTRCRLRVGGTPPTGGILVLKKEWHGNFLHFIAIITNNQKLKLHLSSTTSNEAVCSGPDASQSYNKRRV